MHVDPLFWPKLHGASAHFPIALTLVAAVCEGVALRVADGPRREGLRATGFYSIVAGALGTGPAVLSGLVMTHGETMGHDLLRWHHLFVWPSFALIVGLAVWRWRGGRSRFLYVAVLIAAAVLISAAGYWGGEMIVNG